MAHAPFHVDIGTAAYANGLQSIYNLNTRNARRLASHFITNGHFFAMRRKEGTYDMAFSIAVDLTRLRTKFADMNFTINP